MADYCTLSDVKNYLNITSINSDTLLSSLITSASAYIENWTNRVFSSSSNTAKFNGNNSHIMMLKDYPIISVTSVKVGNTYYSASDGMSVGYVADDVAIYLIGAIYEKGYSNIEISYTSGYATIPADIKQVCIDLVAYKFKETDRVGILSKTMAGEVVSFDSKDLKDQSKNILNNYNRVVPL